MKTSEIISLVTVPFFSGAIGYVTNWSGVWMLFEPVQFKGVRIPGLRKVAELFPREVQEVPGSCRAAWAGRGSSPRARRRWARSRSTRGSPSSAAPSDFYEQLEPDQMAEHIIDSSRGDIRELVERIMQREHPRLWRQLPPRLREAVHERVEQQFPDIVHDVTDEIGDNIDHLLDVKLMVIRKIEERPELCNKIFLEVGRKEFRFIINFGFFFGFACGIPTGFYRPACHAGGCCRCSAC